MFRVGPNDALSTKNHEAGTFSGFGKREQTYKHINTQDISFISIDKYTFVLKSPVYLNTRVVKQHVVTTKVALKISRYHL